MTEIRDKIPEHPTTVALVSADGRGPGRLPDRARPRGGVEVESARAPGRRAHRPRPGFYRALPGWVLENDLKVDEILTLDDSLEAVFQYLTER